MRLRCLILGKTVIRISHFDYRGIDDAQRLTALAVKFNPDLRFCKGIEIPRLCIIDPVGIIVVFHILAGRNLGGPEYDVFSCGFIVKCFRSPGTACSFCRYFYHSLVRPVYQIGRLPDHDGLAAAGLSRCPVVIAVDFQIGGDQIEFIAFCRPHDKGIAKAFFSQSGSQYRFRCI